MHLYVLSIFIFISLLAKETRALSDSALAQAMAAALLVDDVLELFPAHEAADLVSNVVDCLSSIS